MKKTALISLLLFCTVTFSQGQIQVKHILKTAIDPESSYITVYDSVILPAPGRYVFGLNDKLKPQYHSPNIKMDMIKSSISATDVGMDRDDAGGGGEVTVNKWQVVLGQDNISFSIKYEGVIDSVLVESKDNYQRGFSESPGIINKKGVYLAGSTYWIPSFDNSLVTFRLTTDLPGGWKTVSQGKRMDEFTGKALHSDTWECDKPQEEVFLIAAPFTEYSYEMSNGVTAMAFLRTPDESLANKYLEVTEQYMNMYNGLIGDYPYSKFALVENFWETGYGMPSFTLLGEKIIRFPFILHSSYPHELLHNWWGNSVYVDFDKGNWCEGITAYMADHLIKEQHGNGEQYRRSTLQKYTNVVTEENDFPLDRFLSRYNAPTEAVGYGKTLMMWHTVRRKLGDETFIKGFSDFYGQFKYKTASFYDIEHSLEKVSGFDLSDFFKQWITRTGAPSIKIKQAFTDKYNDGFRVFLTLQQVQKGEPFDIDIPVTVATTGGLHTEVFKMERKEQDFQMALDEKPLKLAVDPQYDVFRLLDPNEVPPALSKVWASRRNVFILPASANKNKQKIYSLFVNKWIEADNDTFRIVYDNKIDSLPADETAWIIGFENKFAGIVENALKPYNSSFKGDSVNLEGKKILKGDNSFTVTVFDPVDINKNIVFISPGREDAVDGLIRKLPHYGKYSYLAFEGDEPVNIAKGQWPVINSPLIEVFDTTAKDINMKEPRKALAYVQPVFSEKRMLDHIRYLASQELKGRGLGTKELDEAAEYIAGKFKEYGLKPLDTGYFQIFKHSFPGKGEMTLKNVIAVVPGSDDSLKEYPVIVSAHYDHLGLGWPDVHKGDEGKIHFGADDNASGVAILLELAKNLAKSGPKRTIVFAAFTGEEAGLTGSRYFVENLKHYFKGDVLADVNLDTDGRLFDNKLMVLNANSAREWKFIFMGTDYTTGIKSQIVSQELDASDQFAFIEKGIPAVQLFTGATTDYHRPTDTYDKIDGKGLVKVATVTKEVVQYLAGREEPMQYTGKIHTGQTAPKTVKAKKTRKVSTGSVPDFSYAGEGVKIGSVIEGSAGDKAGLKSGDIITAINGKKVDNLKQYSDALKSFQPGEEIKLSINRDGKEIIIPLTLGER